MTTKAGSARVPGTGQITRFLEVMREGDPHAAEELLSHVYHELHALATWKMAHEARGQRRQPTALVHEAWLGLGVAAPGIKILAVLVRGYIGKWRRISCGALQSIASACTVGLTTRTQPAGRFAPKKLEDICDEIAESRRAIDSRRGVALERARH